MYVRERTVFTLKEQSRRCLVDDEPNKKNLNFVNVIEQCACCRTNVIELLSLYALMVYDCFSFSLSLALCRPLSGFLILTGFCFCSCRLFCATPAALSGAFDRPYSRNIAGICAGGAPFALRPPDWGLELQPNCLLPEHLAAFLALPALPAHILQT